jgi:hypothetical protein
MFYNLHCPACGGLIDRGAYRALGESDWCEPCYSEARNEVTDNYAPEERACIVDLHAAVLGLLEGKEESRP